jgi:hypothetical protein
MPSRSILEYHIPSMPGMAKVDVIELQFMGSEKGENGVGPS